MAATAANVRAYAKAQRLNYATLVSAAFRAGVMLGTETRRERLAIVERLKASGLSQERAAGIAGFSSGPSCCRAKRSPLLKRASSGLAPLTIPEGV